MSRSKSIRGLAAVAVLLVAALPAAAQTLAAGDDALNTLGSGNTSVDLSSFSTAIQNAFGSGVSGSTVVNLQGESLNSSAFGPSVDTLVGRGSISSGGGSLTILALNMASTSPVSLQNGTSWNLQVCLSDDAQTAGTISLTPYSGDSGDGGTFNSSMPVLVKLVFTNTSNSSDVVSIDCGAVSGCSTLTIASTSTGYALSGGPNNFSPSAEGINSLPTGNQTVNNCNGTHTVNLVSPGTFYPGWTLSTGGGGSAAPPKRIGGAFRVSPATDVARIQPQAATGTWSNSGTWDKHSASHKTQPPLDCAGGASPAGAGGARTTPQVAVHYCIAHLAYGQYQF